MFARATRCRCIKASSFNGDAVSFIATAEALDSEMNDRITQHKLERNPKWQTLEESLDIRPPAKVML